MPPKIYQNARSWDLISLHTSVTDNLLISYALSWYPSPDRHVETWNHQACHLQSWPINSVIRIKYGKHSIRTLSLVIKQGEIQNKPAKTYISSIRKTINFCGKLSFILSFISPERLHFCCIKPSIFMVNWVSSCLSFLLSVSIAAAYISLLQPVQLLSLLLNLVH